MRISESNYKRCLFAGGLVVVLLVILSAPIVELYKAWLDFAGLEYKYVKPK